MPWPWRPRYPDHKQRIEEMQAGVALFNPQDMMAEPAEMLEEFRKLLPPNEFEAFAAESAKVDYSKFGLDSLVEDIRRTGEPAPLQFIAQVDLAEVWLMGPVDPDIPREGRLFFFYDTDHRPGGDKPGDITGARLIYDLTPVASLKRASPPAELWLTNRPPASGRSGACFMPACGRPITARPNGMPARSKPGRRSPCKPGGTTSPGTVMTTASAGIRCRFRATCKPNARSSVRGSTSARGIRRRPSG
ncbi:DUF1963 domain-containing protein [Bradyrhizobium sp. JYMT SZCCT0428]|nr:DUF1963 domain-containing protein [Bradyrhizobium sp. JYMT SZCCT0428]